MKSTHRLFFAALALTVLAAPGPARADGVRDAIEAQNQAFVGAFLGGDAKAVANLYTKDAEVIAPGAEIAVGRELIAEFWKKSMDAGVKGITLDTHDVASAGDLASETGTVRLVDADGKETTARYVVVWRRVGDTWFLHRDIWNSAE